MKYIEINEVECWPVMALTDTTACRRHAIEIGDKRLEYFRAVFALHDSVQKELSEMHGKKCEELHGIKHEIIQDAPETWRQTSEKKVPVSPHDNLGNG